jgi:hypothetical protein
MNARSDSRLRTNSLRTSSVGAALVVALVLPSCSSTDEEPAAESTVVTTENTTAADPATTAEPEAQSEASVDPGFVGELFPDVVAVEATLEGGDSWSFSVTLSSPYDSPDRYADSWRVVGPDGTVYGERFLTHDHAGEQPFARSQNGIEIPPDVNTVTVEGRDQVSGWGGTTLEYTLPR